MRFKLVVTHVPEICEFQIESSRCYLILSNKNESLKDCCINFFHLYNMLFNLHLQLNKSCDSKIITKTWNPTLIKNNTYKY